MKIKGSYMDTQLKTTIKLPHIIFFLFAERSFDSFGVKTD